jgi:hypothetical protein
MNFGYGVEQAELTQLAALRPGQQVEVRCKSMQLSMSSPSGFQCRLLSTH